MIHDDYLRKSYTLTDNIMSNYNKTFLNDS